MTDKKQIIIDEVIVSDCKHFCLEAQIPEIPLAGSLNICCEENIAKECKDNPNCYFKQLARKTQLSIEQSKELIRLRQELKESTVKNKNLRQECEELKEEYEKLLNKLNRGVVMPTSEPEVIDLTDRYRMALEEIEDFCKEILGDLLHYSQGSINTTEKILNIISNARKDNHVK